MRKVIESTLVSADGVVGSPPPWAMDADKGGFISKVTGDKRRWRQETARVRQLPPDYHTWVEAIGRYLMHVVPADGDSAAAMFEDPAGLFKKAAADGTPICEIVGEDPAEFVEVSVQNCSGAAMSPPAGGRG